MSVPWSVSLRRNLKVLSPRTWRGIHNALRFPANSSVINWVHHVLIPFLLLTTVIHQPYGHSKYSLGKSAQQAATATLIAPLTIIKIAETIPTLKMSFQRLRQWKTLREEADQQGLDILARDISLGSVIRTAMFDVYFPNVNARLERNSPRKALLFIPGFLIDHTSYASVASRIADEGVIVVVLSLEPMRLPDKFFLELRDLRRCIEAVTKIWNKKYINKNNTTLEWSLGGHSFGGYAAMRLAPQLAALLNKSNMDKLKVIVMAAGNWEFFLTDLTEQDDISIFVLLGTSDVMCKFGEEESKMLKSYLPEDTQIQFINGGSHHNFASYSKEVAKNEISREEQHIQISSATSHFLQNHKVHLQSTD
jgi:alpha/beta superfamily hydrolase